MGRMHSRAKGKSGSHKPVKKVVPSWLKYSAKEVELLVVKYAKEEMKSSVIGLHLRDQYGIPSVKTVTGKSINAILKERKLEPELPEDLMALIKKSVLLNKHLGVNKKDYSSKRGLQLTDSKIRRLVKHYKATKKLPLDWSYNPERFKMYAQQ
ncbi:MAG: 30S ribosomal protein S15 [Candidatus Woesearchaeota archaeon]|jgi:small subunit ribosomal protein S15